MCPERTRHINVSAIGAQDALLTVRVSGIGTPQKLRPAGTHVTDRSPEASDRSPSIGLAAERL
jgi:hypothetical protein